MNNISELQRLERLGGEVTEAIKALEAEQVDGGTPEATPTEYSSSVTSCSVDAEGVISLSVTLHPGNKPIVPVPTQDEQDAARTAGLEIKPPADSPQVPAQ